jgi:antitoxin MazE
MSICNGLFRLNEFPPTESSPGVAIRHEAAKHHLDFPRDRTMLDLQIEKVYQSDHRRMFMRVAKWGNSLAIRLPSGVVNALDLREGDDVSIDIVSERAFEIARAPTRAELIERLRALRGTIPSDFKFDRLDANER